MPISRNNSNFLFCPQLSSLFPPLRQVAPPAQKFVDERPLLTFTEKHDLFFRVEIATVYLLCYESL
jgi:hypothetical protein